MKLSTLVAKRDAARVARQEALITIEHLEKHYKKVKSYRVSAALTEMRKEYEAQDRAWRRYIKRINDQRVPRQMTFEAHSAERGDGRR